MADKTRRGELLPHLAVILVACLVAYFNALRAGFLSIDDVGLMSGLISADFSAKRLFLSGADAYFRPIPFITYYFDAFVAGTNPIWFHGVNVAIHMLNGLMIYFLMLKLTEGLEKRNFIALTAALVFTLHPVNSEAVMWISARPDLLCVLFSLMSLLLMLQHEETPKFSTIVAIFTAFLLSLLSKESSIVLLAIVPLYLLSKRPLVKLKSFALTNIPFYASALLYFTLRSGNNRGIDPGVNSLVTTVIAPVKNSVGPDLFDAMAGFGFYLKKLVYPFPLNFAIVDIGFNQFLAISIFIIALIVSLFIYFNSRRLALPTLLLMGGIILPIWAYLAKVPWTPFAERYLYLPMVGFSMLLSYLLFYKWKIPRIVPVSLALFLAVPTINRVTLWADPVAFWQDVTIKSPTFPRGFIGLGAALIDARDYDGAQKNLLIAQNMGFTKTPLWENLSDVYYAKKDYSSYEAAMVKLSALSSGPVEVYLRLIKKLMEIPERDIERRDVYGKVIGYHLKILEISPNFYLSYYNIGKLFWVLGDNIEAVHYLDMFISKAKNDPMLPYARKIIRRISVENDRSS